VLRGIEVAFEKWRQRKIKRQAVNSLAYCTQAVMAEAEILAGTAKPSRDRKEAVAPFDLEELQSYLTTNAAHLRTIDGFDEIAAALEKLAAEADSHYRDLEQLEQRLTALEDKMAAIARARQSDEDLFHARRELDSQLRPYRGKMTAEQLSMLERQYLARRLFESAGLPRLSLFYLR
jgi:hypothetical protein